MIPCIYLRAFWRRFWVGRGLLFFLTVFLLTACSAKEKQTLITGSDTTSDVASVISSTLDSDKSLTDITELFRNTSESKDSETLLRIAAAEQESIYALYREDAPDGRALRVDAVALSGAETSCVLRIACDDKALTESAFASNFWEIVSTDPLAVYNEQDGIVCLQATSPSDRKSSTEQGITISLPQRMLGASLRSFDGKLWLSTTDGFIYELSTTGELRLAWTLPAQYSFLTPAMGCGTDLLPYKTYEISNPDLAIHLDLDPETGNFETYTQEDDDVYYTASWEDRLLSTYSEDGTSVTLWDAQTTSEYSLQLPLAIQRIMKSQFLTLSAPAFFEAKDGGCLLYLANEEGLPNEIYLWNYLVSEDSKTWMPPMRTPLPEKEVFDYDELGARADELGAKYGLQIILGENVPERFSDYRAEICTTKPIISSALDRLEETLALYPNNFFRTLSKDYYRGICIYLAGGLTPLDVSQNITNAGAFTSVDNGLARIVINLGNPVTDGLLVHELTHVLDHRLVQENWLDEDMWNALNPPDFTYYNAYVDENGERYDQVGSPSHTIGGELDPEEIYFCDLYSKTFPTEDRARLFETLLEGTKEVDPALMGTHLHEKLFYYFQIIRSHLWDDTWPAQTTWETAAQIK